ncbi:protein kinase [Streptomyces sp. NBC_01387]|uniref:protein kinase domain-containing protein n=1 Tax=Streptomyces sp. NBC_01387 TaxID=2903849 RepID=UPI00324BDB1C
MELRSTVLLPELAVGTWRPGEGADRDAGWHIDDLLAFTRVSTLVLAHHDGTAPVVLKAGFRSNHVLAELDEETRPAAYGFYWYAEMTEAERDLTREDFRHEIAVARTATDAEHIVPPIEEGSTEQFDWYTMPHCTDGSFRPLLTKAGGSQAVGLRVLADVADGLATLHERGIVHRDVYQENVLLHEDRGLITDLGAARRLDTPRGPAARGPEVHWPPEYATSYSTATPAADVFSLAVLTYRYLCADIPRHRHSRLETAPAALRPLLSAALVPEPKDRPEMGELRDGLRHPATPTTAPHRAVTDTTL